MFSEVGFRPDAMALPELACVCIKFTWRSNGRESFHQLNTFTLIRSLNGHSVLITFMDTHTSMHTVHRCIKINAPAHKACAHAIPHVCTVTEEVNLIKGQRTQRDSWECTEWYKRPRKSNV